MIFGNFLLVISVCRSNLGKFSTSTPVYHSEFANCVNLKAHMYRNPILKKIHKFLIVFEILFKLQPIMLHSMPSILYFFFHVNDYDLILEEFVVECDMNIHSCKISLIEDLNRHVIYKISFKGF